MRSALDPNGLLLDLAQDKIAVLDERGQFTYVNAAAERTLGFEPEQLIGENAFDYVHPEDRPEVVETFEEITTTEHAFTADTAVHRYRTSDGSWVWLESRMSNLTDAGIDGYVVCSRDITDRVMAQRERRETQERLEEIANTTDDVLWMFDADWDELLFCNPAYENLFGMPVDQLQNDPQGFLDCIHPDDVPVVRAAMERLSEGEQVDMEYRVNPKRNYNRWAWVQGEPIVQAGEVVRIAGFARDITSRRRREQQMVVMDNLLRHNIRNDMNVILGNVKLIEEMAHEEAAEKAAVIRRTGKDLIETAEKQRRMIDFLTGSAGPERVELAGSVRDAVEPLARKYEHATIITNLPDSMDAFALREIEWVVAELVENSIQHGESATPSVTVEGRCDGTRAELTVRDDGPPIPEYDAQVLTGEHVMDSIYHSSGCGLWLVYWVVDLSEGEVSYTYSEQEGNRITVALQSLD